MGKWYINNLVGNGSDVQVVLFNMIELIHGMKDGNIFHPMHNFQYKLTYMMIPYFALNFSKLLYLLFYILKLFFNQTPRWLYVHKRHLYNLLTELSMYFIVNNYAILYFCCDLSTDGKDHNIKLPYILNSLSISN